MNNEFKDILPDALKDKNISGGFEYANIMAANGYTVIWPSNVNQIDYIVVTMPRLIEPVAVTKIITIINSIKDDKSISSLIAYYKKPRSPKII
jgi:aromatic ring-opening dioxygenase LigB subunit